MDAVNSVIFEAADAQCETSVFHRRHIEPVLRSSCTIIFAFLFLFACNRETELREQVTGTWMRGDDFEMTLAADGTFISRWTLPAKSVVYQGTWKVQSDRVVSTITNCIAQGTTNVQPSGTVDHWVIVRTGPSELIWSNDGQSISLTRKK